jgi:hypothetical protein
MASQIAGRTGAKEDLGLSEVGLLSNSPKEPIAPPVGAQLNGPLTPLLPVLCSPTYILPPFLHIHSKMPCVIGSPGFPRTSGTSASYSWLVEGKSAVWTGQEMELQVPVMGSS